MYPDYDDSKYESGAEFWWDDAEEAAERCGFDDEQGICLLAGTEDCDFFCPFRPSEGDDDATE